MGGGASSRKEADSRKDVEDRSESKSSGVGALLPSSWKDATENLKDDLANLREDRRERFKKSAARRAAMVAWKRLIQCLEDYGLVRASCLKLHATIMQQDILLEQNLAELDGWKRLASAAGQEDESKKTNGQCHKDGAVEEGTAVRESNATVSKADLPSVSSSSSSPPLHQRLVDFTHELQERVQAVEQEITMDWKDAFPPAVQQVVKILQDKGGLITGKMASLLESVVEDVLAAFEKVKMALERAQTAMKKHKTVMAKCPAVLKELYDGKDYRVSSVEALVSADKDALVEVLEAFTWLRRKVRALEKHMEALHAALDHANEKVEGDPLDKESEDAWTQLRGFIPLVQDLGKKAEAQVGLLRATSEEGANCKEGLSSVSKDLSRLDVRRLAERLQEGVDDVEEDSDGEAEKTRISENFREMLEKVADFVDKFMDIILDAAFSASKHLESDLSLSLGFHWSDFLRLKFSVTLQLKIVAECLADLSKRRLDIAIEDL